MTSGTVDRYIATDFACASQDQRPRPGGNKIGPTWYLQLLSQLRAVTERLQGAVRIQMRSGLLGDAPSAQLVRALGCYLGRELGPPRERFCGHSVHFAGLSFIKCNHTQKGCSGN